MGNEARLQTSVSFYIYTSLLLLILPFWWFASMSVCVFFHELFHVLAAKALGIEINRIKLSARGVIIETHPMSALQELVCAAAGPIGGLIPVILMRFFPKMAFIALLLTAYNLLPFYPLDGGRILKCMLTSRLPNRIAKKIYTVLEYISAVALLGMAGYWSYRLHGDVFPILICLLPLLRAKIEKHLANERQKQYNIPITDKGVTL